MTRCHILPPSRAFFQNGEYIDAKVVWISKFDDTTISASGLEWCAKFVAFGYAISLLKLPLYTFGTRNTEQLSCCRNLPTFIWRWELVSSAGLDKRFFISIVFQPLKDSQINIRDCWGGSQQSLRKWVGLRMDWQVRLSGHQCLTEKYTRAVLPSNEMGRMWRRSQYNTCKCWFATFLQRVARALYCCQNQCFVYVYGVNRVTENFIKIIPFHKIRLHCCNSSHDEPFFHHCRYNLIENPAATDCLSSIRKNHLFRLQEWNMHIFNPTFHHRPECSPILPEYYLLYFRLAVLMMFFESNLSTIFSSFYLASFCCR